MGFQAMTANMGDGPTPGPCTVTIYRFDQQTVETYDTGSLCDYGIPIPNSGGDQLYRAIRPSAALVRYNPFTGERRTLMIGEIEALGEVSSDGAYALVGMGRGGAYTDQDPDINFGLVVEPYYNLVVDLNTGEAVGELPTGASWLSPSHLLTDTTLYTLENGGLTETMLPGTVVYSIAEGELAVIKTPNHQVIIQTPNDQVGLYDAVSGDFTPLLTLQPDDTLYWLAFDNSNELWRISWRRGASSLFADVRLP
jgi:hypothetical protein